jgi:hypothetical protein
MARIPDAELERLKREVSLARLIEGQGHRLISQGKDLACRCPWHEGDDTPSCIVSPKTNLWHCFGCNLGGSVIDWIMRSHKVSFRHACELLAKQHPTLAAAEASSAPQKLSQGKLRQAQSFSLEDGDQALLDQVIEFYHQTLKASPEALQYLDSRGLGNLELIERFKLGYANRTLAYRLAPKQYKAGAEHRAALQRIGVLRESGHEHLNGSIVIPLFGVNADGHALGHVVGAYGRKVNQHLRPGTPKHLYLPGPQPAAGRNGLRFQYELLFDGQLDSSAPQMIGLIDANELHGTASSSATTATWQGSESALAPTLHPAITPLAPTLRGAHNEEKPCAESALSSPAPTTTKQARQGKRSATHRTRTASTSAPSSESSLLAADSAGV